MRVSGFDAFAGFARLPRADVHQPAANQILNLAAAPSRKVGGKKHVEPLPRLVGPDDEFVQFRHVTCQSETRR